MYVIKDDLDNSEEICKNYTDILEGLIYSSRSGTIISWPGFDLAKKFRIRINNTPKHKG